MQPNIRLVTDDGIVRKEEIDKISNESVKHLKKNNKHINKGKNIHHVVIGAAAVGTVTVIELRHGGRILIEPFESASSFNDLVNDLMGLSDVGVTGWLVWLGVVAGTVYSGIAYCAMKLSRIWKRDSRTANDED